jgi:hypothetical protein
VRCLLDPERHGTQRPLQNLLLAIERAAAMRPE